MNEAIVNIFCYGMSVSISNEPRKASRVAAIDAIKAISAQLIVLHHFCIYGPMTDAAWGFAPGMFKWFANDGRLAVQCFLVMAGFLAAGVMLPAGGKPWSPPPMSRLPAIAFQRYIRLAKTFLVGLAAAIVCAAIARALTDDPTTPAAPTWMDLAANIVFAQDLLGIPALTAGAWYVAIDLQLYSMLALICAMSAFIANGAQSTKVVAMSVTTVLGLCSLVIFNRHAEFEMWGFYFFGSYSLGMIAHWVSYSKGGRKWAWLSVMAIMCALALMIQWRSRIAVSTITAFVLALRGTHRATNSNWLGDAASFLSRISFPLFVLHYPTLMLVGSLVKVGWGDAALPNTIGLGVAWMLSMTAANALSLWLESPKKISIRLGDTQIVV
jgi:peptidoglycan/LPS O-acetylase OafA/YrhL